MSGPLWDQIRATLSAEIADGRFARGARLPTEAGLAARFGVNRHTVRRAIAEMQAAGLVHARRGSGVYVTGSPVAYRVGGRARFTRNLRDGGHSGARRILRLDTVPCTRAEAEALGLATRAPVHVLESVGVIDEVPALYSRSLFPADPLPGFVEAMHRTSSITAALGLCGIGDYHRDWTRLTAEQIDGLIARHLHLREGAPVIVAMSLNRIPDGTAIEHARTVFSGERVELMIDAQCAP